jgi:AcrR family transcriptional regulator
MNIARLTSMDERVNRRYVAPRRAAAAGQTRHRILQASRALFVARGWQGTTVAEIARQAEVSVDTVYASVGRKPMIIRAAIDDVLGEGRGPVPAEQRRYVEDVRAAPTAEDKIATYTAALGRLMPDIAPLLLTLRDAGSTDADCAQAWHDITGRRADNMLQFAADLRKTGRLRRDLSDQAVADLVWATNSPEYHSLLTSRGWTTLQYTEHLNDLWQRLLLAG